MANLAPTGHSKFSPSASKRWLNCVASIVLPQPERTTSPEAEEGTAAHEVAAWAMLEGDFNAAAFPDPTASNGVPVTDEMKHYVQIYLDNVREYWEALSDGDDEAQLLVEAEVDYSGVVGLEKGEATGTSDVIIIAPAAGIVSVHDLKYGRGVEVDAVGNTQLRIYGLGAIASYPDECADMYKLQTVIHQVRKQKEPKEDSLLVSELMDFADQVLDTVTRINMLTPETLTLEDYAPGEDVCRFCPHEAICPARAALVDDLFEDLTEIEIVDSASRDEAVTQAKAYIADLKDNALDELYPSLGLIEDFCAAVRKEIESRVQAGAKYANAKLVLGKQGNRAWEDEEAVEALLKTTFRIKSDEMYDKKLISPTKAEKLFKDNPTRWARLQEHITRSDAKPILVPMSDKRPAVGPIAFTDESNNIDDLI